MINENDTGPEEYDPKEPRQLGNFPPAFSHFVLVNAAIALAEAKAARKEPRHASDATPQTRPQ